MMVESLAETCSFNYEEEKSSGSVKWTIYQRYVDVTGSQNCEGDPKNHTSDERLISY